MKLQGSRCALRRWRRGDEDALVRYASNRKIWRNLSDRFPHPYTLDVAREWIELRANDTPPYANFCITVGDEAIGATGFDVLSDIHRIVARAGYWLGEPFWGRGIATEAFSLLRDYAFASFPDIHRIEATVFEWNPASMRVLEKCGFALEARMRKAVMKDGEVIDQFLFARVRDSS
ncbi:MAG: GNAT family N-acetyltransferase [Candidatus Hydrogenedentes bacterium]|nr:GNAT family N-acetyltransferase [Candidatus Hydrogenedentota bacterium]